MGGLSDDEEEDNDPLAAETWQLLDYHRILAAWSHGIGLIITWQKVPQNFPHFTSDCHATWRGDHPVAYIVQTMRCDEKNVARVTKSGEFLWESWGVQN